MTSTRKINANRANAQASTGPRTGQGKVRSALNAYRHGLSLSVTSNPVLAEQVEVLTRKFVGNSTDPEIVQLAHEVAEAQIDLLRIRWARHDLLARDHGDGTGGEAAMQLIRLDRYEQRAWSRRKFAIRAYDLARRQATRNHGAPPPTADSN
jgi:hypothetical protein